jgi:ribosomal-protein-alanine N-acetyltransferase
VPLRTSNQNMIKTVIVTELKEDYYIAASNLWELTGVGNPARADTFDAVQKTLLNGAKLILVYEDEQPVGTVWLTHDFRRLYLHHMAVHPDHQNKGYGKLLMQEALKLAGELKLQTKLEVHPDNLPANKLYAQFGFEALDGYRIMIKRDV